MALLWVPSLAVILVVAGIYRILQIGKRDPRMPIGPPTLPIIGNAHQIPSTGVYKLFRDWAKEYGPVFSLKFGPANIVVLCDRKAIHKLLVEKGNIYSDRPDSYAVDLITKGDHIAFGQMTPAWREKRKIVSSNFSPTQLDQKHYKVLEAEATLLMNDLLQTPEDFFDHVCRYTASVATSLTYGFRAPTFNSFWGHSVFEVMGKMSVVLEPGANPPVDEFPFLRYIPARFAFWKRRAIAAGDTMDNVWLKARQLVNERRAKGDHRQCIIDNLLDRYEKEGFPFTQHEFNNLMGEMIEGGADTTSAQLKSMILAFALHPEAQKKACLEIDAVCGTARSPDWSDFEKLPYVNCILKEGMRWRPVAVSALPHRVREDDEYEGKLIPKHTMLFIPTWALHHTESFFPDPDKFNPDRYGDHKKLANDYAASPDWESRDHYNYGAGRRICPGIHFAERNMWRIVAKLLWAFEFSEPIDPKTGKIMPLDPDAYKPGALQTPLKFKVGIKPRSAAHVATIKEEIDGAMEFLKQFD